MTRVHREVSVCKVVAVPEVQCCCCAVTNNYNNYEVTAALKCIEYADTGHQQSHAAAERCEPICAPAICMNYELLSLPCSRLSALRGITPNTGSDGHLARNQGPAGGGVELSTNLREVKCL